MVSVSLRSFVIVSRPKSESHFYCTLSYLRPHPRKLLTAADVRLKAEPEVKEHCGWCCSRVVALLLLITMRGQTNSSLGWFVLNQVAIVSRIFSTAVLRMLWPHRTFEIVFVDCFFCWCFADCTSDSVRGEFLVWRTSQPIDLCRNLSVVTSRMYRVAPPPGPAAGVQRRLHDHCTLPRRRGAAHCGAGRWPMLLVKLTPLNIPHWFSMMKHTEHRINRFKRI